MRDYFDEILQFIGAESLTDGEFEACTLDDILDEVANYDFLLGVLQARETVSSSGSRLQYYFQAMGVEVETPSTAQSNIFVGGSLE